MGMDTVELVMKFERYFNIQIPDPVAEQMTTPQEAAGAIAGILNITDAATPLRDYYFTFLHNLLARFEADSPAFTLSSPIAHHLSPRQELKWQQVKEALQLNVPMPVLVDPGEMNTLSQLKKRIMGAPAYDWNQLTTEQFILAILAVNYQSLVQTAGITNTYDILVAVTGITIDHAGSDPYETMPGSTFTSDLGLD